MSDSVKNQVPPWVSEPNPTIQRRIGKMGEEATELSKVCFRILLQGIHGIDPANGKSNIIALTEEIADVMTQCELAVMQFQLSESVIHKRIVHKKKQMEEWERLMEDLDCSMPLTCSVSDSNIAP